MTVKFWGANNKNGFLSNFYPSPFSAGDLDYLTVEHWFQSKKFEGTLRERRILNMRTAAETAKEGKRRDPLNPLRPDWEEVKEAIMYEGLQMKFKDPALKRLLLDTGEAELIEDSPYDYYWGVGRNQTGKNRLGILLMRLREELKSL